MVKQILFLVLITACAQQPKGRFENQKYNYLSPKEKKRALYYKNLRLKKRKTQKKRLRLSAQENIILSQHIQMKCFEKRIKQSKCDKLLTRKPDSCIKLIKKRRISKVGKCLDKALFYK